MRQASTPSPPAWRAKRDQQLGRLIGAPCVVGQDAIEALRKDFAWAIRHIAKPTSAMHAKAYSMAAPGQIAWAPNVVAVLTPTQFATLWARGRLGA